MLSEIYYGIRPRLIREIPYLVEKQCLLCKGSSGWRAGSEERPINCFLRQQHRSHSSRDMNASSVGLVSLPHVREVFVEVLVQLLGMPGPVDIFLRNFRRSFKMRESLPIFS